MLTEHYMSMATALKSHITEVSHEWVGAVQGMNTDIAQIAMTTVMQENVLAAEESPSVAKAVGARCLCKKLG